MKHMHANGYVKHRTLTQHVSICLFKR